MAPYTTSLITRRPLKKYSFMEPPTDKEIVDFFCHQWATSLPYEMHYDLVQMCPEGSDNAYNALQDENDFRRVMAMVMGRLPIPPKAT